MREGRGKAVEKREESEGSGGWSEERRMGERG